MKNIPTQVVKISDLRNWEKNPREIAYSQFALLKDYITKYGLLKPLLVDGRDNVTVLGGNMRLKALKDLGYSEVEVKVIPIEDDKEALEVAMIDNSSFGVYVKSKLKDLSDDMTEKLKRIQLDIRPIELEDLLAEKKAKEDGKGEVPFTAEILESNNYLVFIFDNVMDWNVVKDEFDIKTVQSLDSKADYMRKGIGRVVDGRKLIEKIRKS